MKKKIALLVFSGVLSLSSITACSSTTNNDARLSAPASGASGGEAAGKEPVTLTFWSRIGSIGNQMQATIDEFQAANPNIKVDYSYTNGSGYPSMLQAALSSGELPDMFTSVSSFPTDQLVKLGAIREINDVIPADRRGGYVQGIWAEGSTLLDGDVYAYPLADPRETSIMMFYNKKALKSVGMTERDLPKTWDDLLAFGRRVQEASSGQVYGLVVGVKSFSYLAMAAAQMATAITPEVNTDVYFSGQFNYRTGKYELGSPGTLQTIDYFKKLLDEKVLHPSSLVMNYREGTTLMESGQAVLAFDSYNYASTLGPETWDSFGVAPLPTFEGKPSHYSYLGGGGLSLYVAKSTKHEEEVKLFLEFLKDHFFPKLIASGYNYSPIVAMNKSLPVANPVAAEALKIKDEQVRLVPMPASQNPNAIKVATEMSGKFPKVTLGDVMEGYLSGQLKDAKGALSQASDEYNQLLADSIEKVNKDGARISEEDYKFPDWNPAENYANP